MPEASETERPRVLHLPLKGGAAGGVRPCAHCLKPAADMHPYQVVHCWGGYGDVEMCSQCADALSRTALIQRNGFFGAYALTVDGRKFRPGTMAGTVAANLIAGMASVAQYGTDSPI